MGVYVRWVGSLLVGNVVCTFIPDIRNEEITLLFRYMDEERVWLLTRHEGFLQGVQLSDSVSMTDLIHNFNDETCERAIGIHWNTSNTLTKLERVADELMRYDRVDEHEHCPVVRFIDRS